MKVIINFEAVITVISKDECIPELVNSKEK